MQRWINNVRYHTNWWAYYYYKWVQRARGPFLFKGRRGIRLEVPRRLLPTYKECFFDQTYSKKLPAAIKSNPPQTILDIGANVGYFTFAMLHRYPRARIFAYEPVPANFSLLQSYLRQHPQFAVKAYQEAVSGDGQPLKLYMEKADAFTTAASVHQEATLPIVLTVPSITLEEIFTRHGWSAIDWVKLDCEGAEYNILYHTPKHLLQNIHVLTIETHRGEGVNNNTNSLCRWLRVQGFIVRSKGSKIWAWRRKAIK